MSIRSLLVESSELCCTVGLEDRMRVLLLLLTVLPISAVQSELIGFDQATPGKLPADWVVAMTHAGAPPRWEIVRDESAPSPPNVLAQLSRDRTAGRFPLAIWDQALFQNGELSVAFKTVDGAIDQAAGIVWRYQNANNYYIVRANALENNVVFYKVENGVRTSIAPKGLPSRSYGVKHLIPSGRWNTLKVTFNGAKIAVFLNQENLFEAEDTTFQKPGKIGLWTKADSVTYFDDFTVAGARESLK
jgi:hypothetical protein